MHFTTYSCMIPGILMSDEVKIAVLETQVERLLEKQKELTERVRANEKVVAAIGLFGSVAVAFIGAGYFAPCELTINVEDTVTFVNNELPPHNVMFAGHDELSHNDLAFSPGERIEVTFEKAGDYDFQCDPHAGAGMKGVIHVQ